MNHAVHTADIDKSAVGNDRAHRAGVNLTYFCLRPEGILRSLACFLEHHADRTHRTAAGLIDLNDAELNMLMQQAIQRLAAGGKWIRLRWPSQRHPKL